MPKPKFGRPRTRVSTGKVGSFLTGGGPGGLPQPVSPKPKEPKPTQREKDMAILKEMAKSGALKPKYVRGLKKR